MLEQYNSKSKSYPILKLITNNLRPYKSSKSLKIRYARYFLSIFGKTTGDA